MLDRNRILNPDYCTPSPFLRTFPLEMTVIDGYFCDARPKMANSRLDFVVASGIPMSRLSTTIYSPNCHTFWCVSLAHTLFSFAAFSLSKWNHPFKTNPRRILLHRFRIDHESKGDWVDRSEQKKKRWKQGP